MRLTKLLMLSAAIAAPIMASTPALGQDWSLSGNAAGSSDILGTTNTQDFRIRTNNTERMRIAGSNPYVGINTTSSLYRLSIYNNGGPQMRLEDGAGAWDLWGGGDFIIRRGLPADNTIWFSMSPSFNQIAMGPNEEIFMDTNLDRVGIGTSAPLTTLTVDGDLTPATDCGSNIGSSVYRWNLIYACNGTIQTSDARLKDNIKTISYGLDEVMKLRPVTYTWKNDPAYGQKLGLIAQEVQPFIGEAVKTGEDGSMGIFYSDLIPVLVKALQEQQAEIKERVAQKEALQAKVAERARRIARMEALLGSQSNQ